MIFVAILLVFAITAFNIFLGIQLRASASTMFDNYLYDISRVQAVNLKGYFDDIESRFNSILKLPAIEEYTSGSYADNSKEYKAAAETLTALVEAGTISKAVIYDDGDKISLFCLIAHIHEQTNGFFGLCCSVHSISVLCRTVLYDNQRCSGDCRYGGTYYS